MTKNETINIDGLQFGWETQEGLFTYEGEDAVLFWVTTVMREFFDALEEVSGEEAARVVLETTGFRQGVVVGEYFSNMKNVNVEEAAALITATYASAGWGLAEIHKLDIENKTLEVYLKNSWEHKVNVAQKKERGGDFLPAHYAGIFTQMFGQNIWYEVIHYQLEGYDETVIHYFPSEESVEKNIHRLVRQKEAEQIERLEALVKEKTEDLNQLIKEISSPIIPVLEEIVVIPLLGTYDEDRTGELLEKTLEQLPKYRAEYMVLDLTGLNDNFTEHAASLIEKLGAAASLIGTETIIVGISPQVSMTIQENAVDLKKFNCFHSLQHGIHYALAQKGRSIL
ncbi:STAS domain-containing protein [Alkalicoccus daliensis]|uniref:Anti-anti-sigma regulatory factor (Antagonist of anti-sigma factor) n=1 Tax=Alkalicoccus daliensis TaxID=745820 RepID=A0A1H0HRB2_9BACI|nr:STAS domain-containing protein [Alkalicoccus daliensis]SDO21600.1 Anti-anti-sigma regulatory factor (antagonist of anti-sigma factor) [Alkalicoccus daliensis]